MVLVLVLVLIAVFVAGVIFFFPGEDLADEGPGSAPQ